MEWVGSSFLDGGNGLVPVYWVRLGMGWWRVGMGWFQLTRKDWLLKAKGERGSNSRSRRLD